MFKIIENGNGKKISFFLKQFGIKAHNYDFYEIAFTHPSVNFNKKDAINYQKLEFIGDAILGCIIAILSYRLQPSMNEGHLSRLKSSLVNTKNLSKLALKYHFQNYIKVGSNFNNDISKSQKVLEDVFEAFIGAVYLDNNFNYVFNLVNKIFKNEIINFVYEKSIDFKTKIQELMQAKEHSINLKYQLLKKDNLIFKVGLFHNDKMISYGYGSNKKKAEQAAAKNALKKITTI